MSSGIRLADEKSKELLENPGTVITSHNKGMGDMLKTLLERSALTEK